MYTLTRKLAVVCLTLVLSVLVYGCGGSSNKQALITTPVSTDMVTARPGNYARYLSHPTWWNSNCWRYHLFMSRRGGGALYGYGNSG